MSISRYHSCPAPDIVLTFIACAIAAERHDIVVEQARKLIGQHQFNNEPLRILLASLASGLKVTDSFITSTLQKHLFREMKLSDTAVKNPDILKWNPLNKRYAATGQGKSTDPDDGGEDDGEENERGSFENESAAHDKYKRPEIPTKENPVIVAIYGQICIAAKSYQSAICTFYLFIIKRGYLSDANGLL